jgi:hypothetical protein
LWSKGACKTHKIKNTHENHPDYSIPHCKEKKTAGQKFMKLIEKAINTIKNI